MASIPTIITIKFNFVASIQASQKHKNTPSLAAHPPQNRCYRACSSTLSIAPPLFLDHLKSWQAPCRIQSALAWIWWRWRSSTTRTNIICPWSLLLRPGPSASGLTCLWRDRSGMGHSRRPARSLYSWPLPASSIWHSGRISPRSPQSNERFLKRYCKMEAWSLTF